jgi:hypothetical protein
LGQPGKYKTVFIFRAARKIQVLHFGAAPETQNGFSFSGQPGKYKTVFYFQGSQENMSPSFLGQPGKYKTVSSFAGQPGKYKSLIFGAVRKIQNSFSFSGQPVKYIIRLPEMPHDIVTPYIGHSHPLTPSLRCSGTL